MIQVQKANRNLPDGSNYIFASDNCSKYGGGLVEVQIDKEDFNRCRKFGWYISRKGYVYTLIDNKTIMLHRFLLNFPKDVVVDHNDGNKLNNRKKNLILMSNVDNLQKAWYVQGLFEHIKIPIQMFSYDDFEYKKPLKEFQSQKDAANYLKSIGVSAHQGAISNACSGRRKSASGYRWNYKT